MAVPMPMMVQAWMIAANRCPSAAAQPKMTSHTTFAACAGWRHNLRQTQLRVCQETRDGLTGGDGHPTFSGAKVCPSPDLQPEAKCAHSTGCRYRASAVVGFQSLPKFTAADVGHAQHADHSQGGSENDVSTVEHGRGSLTARHHACHWNLTR